MNDQHSSGPNSGLEELVQRIKAISDPAPEGRPRSRETQLPFGSVANGNRASYGAYEDVRLAAPLPPPDIQMSGSVSNAYKQTESGRPQSGLSTGSQATTAAPEWLSEYPSAQSYAAEADQPKSPTPTNGMNLGASLPFASTAAYGSVSFAKFGSEYSPESARASAEVPVSEEQKFVPHTTESSAPPSSSTPSEVPNTDDVNAPKSGLQRAINAVRAALPLVQKLLPLLDGNFATAITALVAPSASSPSGQPAPQQQVKVNLEPVERALNEVRNSNRELRTQVLEQVNTFKRVEDQLERVREATDRNTLEQQELVEDLRSVGNRVSAFAIIGLILLVLSVGINVFFLVQLQRVLR